MTIEQLIQAYQAANLAEDTARRLPHSKDNQAAYYAAISENNRCKYLMINHPDWTIELHDQHYAD